MKVLKYTLPTDFMANKIFDASRIGILYDFQPSYPEIFLKFMHFSIFKNKTEYGYFLDCHYQNEISFISSKKVPIEILAKSKGVLELISDSIDFGYYLLIPIDTQYISKYPNYQKYSYLHHLFVYGYDEEKKITFCGDFFKYGNGKFSIHKVPFFEIEKAYHGVINYLNTIPDPADNTDEWMRDIEMLRVMKNQRLEFSLEKLIINLGYFLEGKDINGNKRVQENVFYGMEVYGLCMKYLEDLYDFSKKKIDIRILALLYYRYIFMKKQCQYVVEKVGMERDSILEIGHQYENLQKISHCMVLYAMKYNLTMKGDCKNKTMELLRKCHAQDEDVTKRYLSKLTELY